MASKTDNPYLIFTNPKGPGTGGRIRRNTEGYR